MLRKKYWHYIVICALIAVLSGISYANFISDKIYEESTLHLQETYAEVNKAFSALADKNWNMLMDWNEYLIYGLDDLETDRLDEYFQSDKTRWGYTEVYFLNEHGDYLTLDLKRGHMNCGSQLSPLMEEKQKVVMDAIQQDGTILTVFAVPAERNTYHGFSYSAMAVSYDNRAMSDALNVTSFSGKSRCYMLYPTGRVMLSTAEQSPGFNFISYLTNHSSLSDAQIHHFRENLSHQKKGSLKYRADGVSYYLVYQPVGFQDWMMVGTVPKKAVNTNIPQIQIVTIIALSVIFLTVAVMAVTYLIRRNKQTLAAKDEQLLFQEELFNILVHNSQDIFILCSKEHESIDYISPNIERLLGLKPENIGDDLQKFNATAIDAEKSILNMDLHKIREGTPLQANTQRYNIQTGKHRWYHETLYPVIVQGYKKVLLVLSDRSSEWHNHQQLELALDIAKSANEAKSSFLSNMSHDIRTPMNAITGFTSLLSESADDPAKVRDYAAKITAASQHLLGLINDVLDMSKIESGKLVIHVQAFDLQELLDELNTIILPLATTHHQSFTIQTQDLTCRKLYGDPLRISQILLNLLSNSVKYTPEGGNICLSVRMQGVTSRGRLRLLFEVEDDGIGIEPDFLHTIFEPFTREEGKIQNEVQGTGLGMAITKNLVDLMGGQISVKSTPNIGSKFSVELEMRTSEDGHRGESAEKKRAFMEAARNGSAGDENACGEVAGVVSAFEDVDEVEDTVDESPDHGIPQNETAGTEPPATEARDQKPLSGLHLLVAEDNAFNAEIMEDLLALKGATCEIASTGQKAVDLFTGSESGHFDAILMDIQMPDMDGYEATRKIRQSNHPEHTSMTIIAITANAFAEDIQQALASGMNAHLPKPIDLDVLCQLLRNMV